HRNGNSPTEIKSRNDRANSGTKAAIIRVSWRDCLTIGNGIGWVFTLPAGVLFGRAILGPKRRGGSESDNNNRCFNGSCDSHLFVGKCCESYATRKIRNPEAA